MNQQQIFDDLRSLPENKFCMECGDKSPTYVCTNLGIFLCSTCSSIHREFGHRIKSITLSTFTNEEIELIRKTGNKVAKSIWLARWTQHAFPPPQPNDKERIRTFVKLKYIDKMWVSLASSASQSVVTPSSLHDSDLHRLEPQPQQQIPSQEKIHSQLGLKFESQTQFTNKQSVNVSTQRTSLPPSTAHSTTATTTELSQLPTTHTSFDTDSLVSFEDLTIVQKPHSSPPTSGQMNSTATSVDLLSSSLPPISTPMTSPQSQIPTSPSLSSSCDSPITFLSKLEKPSVLAPNSPQHPHSHQPIVQSSPPPPPPPPPSPSPSLPRIGPSPPPPPPPPLQPFPQQPPFIPFQSPPVISPQIPAAVPMPVTFMPQNFPGGQSVLVPVVPQRQTTGLPSTVAQPIIINQFGQPISVLPAPIGVFPQNVSYGSVPVVVSSPGGLQPSTATAKSQQILSDFELAKKLQAEEDQKAKKISSTQKPADIDADFLLAMKLQEEENQQSGRHSFMSDEELARKLQEEEEKNAGD